MEAGEASPASCETRRIGGLFSDQAIREGAPRLRRRNATGQRRPASVEAPGRSADDRRHAGACNRSGDYLWFVVGVGLPRKARAASHSCGSQRSFSMIS